MICDLNIIDMDSNDGFHMALSVWCNNKLTLIVIERKEGKRLSKETGISIITLDNYKKMIVENYNSKN